MDRSSHSHSHGSTSPSPFQAARRVSNESELGSVGYSSSSGGMTIVAAGTRECRPAGHHPYIELPGETTAHGNARKLVEHNYHDYSQVAPPSSCASSSFSDSDDATATTTTPVFVTRGGTATLFPLKLYGLLDDAMSADPRRDRQLPGVLNGQILSQIVCFQPHGRAFKVQDVPLFKACVLPVYFGKMKYSSFLRQLNLYGFTRLSKGPDKGGYYHELFLQHRQYLVYRIQRMKVKGSGTRAAANPDKEPNFYAMTYMRDIPYPHGRRDGGNVNGGGASPNLPAINPNLVRLDLDTPTINGSKKRKATTTTKAGQHTSEMDTILNDDMLFEPFPVAPTAAGGRSTHRQVSVTSSDLHDSHSSLDSFHLADLAGDGDEDIGVTDDLDLDLSMLEDLLDDAPPNREENDSTQAVAAPSPTASSFQVSLATEPRPMAVPPFLMSHDAASRYNVSFASATPNILTATAAAATTTDDSIPPIPNFDTNEITFLQSLFAGEAAALLPMSPIKCTVAAAKKSVMEAAANAQTDYRNNAATNGGRSRFQNIRAARTA
uniref:HSF-type DNA-binding domain-containing protein n=1 Tax=Minutocellus polymorphus TaxID=265543 RepID=A0A7S0ADT0_9STRA|mmetsp:Transcript_11671/g.19394  ORF Transcript_11671/g.19394 Transcript_11671/m.19394 type:complete len:549 (+) Transcript_11671:383-2029(+)|eukprot:CAMPEP_0197723568 /NCGR_PEP_ID=MMETSP1434-20131217/5834_1 /TAXON_ID=265543 /ORGANISM="Minutocellus polymorphus, Strain CCMP3303" /LENGTH=548 /DNA_ID=CAMNT_0043308845 /DNA_START=381 /DNA_END=2027 /DNA_ORIENTATION=-